MTSHPDPRAWQRPEDWARLRRQAWSTPKTIFLRRTTPVTSRPPRSRATTPPSPRHGEPFGLIGDPEPLPYVQPGGRHSLGAYRRRAHRDRTGSPATTAAGRRAGAAPRTSACAAAAGRRRAADRHGLQKAFGLWGGPGLDGFEKSLTDMGFQHADILTYVGDGRSDRGGRAAGARAVHPGGRCGRAGVPRQRACLAEAMAAHEEARLPSFLTDGHEYQVILIVRGRRDHPDRARPLRVRRRPRLGPPPVRRLVRRAAAGRRARASRCGCCSTAATRWPDRLLVRVGHAARAGLGQQRQRRERHRGQPQLGAVLESRLRPRALAEPQARRCRPTATVWLPSSVRAVTVSRSATVR